MERPSISLPQVTENCRQFSLLRTDILQKTVVRCPCLSSMTFFNLSTFTGREKVAFKRIGMSTYYFNLTTTTTSHFLSGRPGPFLYSTPHPTNRRCSRAIRFLNSSYFFLMTLIASIITFSKKKILEKKYVTLDPRHGTLALDMEPSTLDPRQKDRLALARRLFGSSFLN